MIISKKMLFFIYFLFLIIIPPAFSQQPKIIIIIDDLGFNYQHGKRAIALPGKVTFAILPHSPHGKYFAELVHQLGKDVMLHLPMQPLYATNVGPGALTIDMDHTSFLEVLNGNLKAVPYVVGVNNHMGSLLTQHPGNMIWLMDALKKNHLFFVDSRTTSESVAIQIAREKNVPHLTRDIFLDAKIESAFIKQQFQQLIKLAKKRGYAIAIGHPHPATLAVLEKEIPRLKKQGVKLVSVTEFLSNHPIERVTT